jgi:hypothetical protein
VRRSELNSLEVTSGLEKWEVIGESPGRVLTLGGFWSLQQVCGKVEGEVW